ncbi:MAG: DUF2946 family protein [Deltaproteobacteria bacterium]|nr:DUF2946 family protein [Deltaproteobacteria bacterium]
MTWTRQILRAWSALCLALVVYGATPHVHHEADAARSGPSVAEGSAGGLADGDAPTTDAASGLRRDDAHDSHSSTASTDGHPCTLCRDKSDRELAAPATVAIPLATPTALRIDRLDVAARVELLLARRHPARAPPLAA